MVDLLYPFPATGKTPSITGLYDVLHKTQETDTTLAGNLHYIGKLHLILGDGAAALQTLQVALARGEPSTALSITWGQALCYVGQYADAKNIFERVTAAAQQDTPPDPKLRALALFAYGSAYYLDQPEAAAWDGALALLSQALPLLQSEQLLYHAAACLLATAELHLRKRQMAEAMAALKQADEAMTQSRIFWFRPKWWLLQAQAELDQGDCRRSAALACKGLSALDDRGDQRMLPGLYRVMATALERNHERIEDARDARHRSVISARARASRLDLGWALHELGHHYKLFTNRPTLRAKGSGYLYEAEQLFRAMGLPAPATQPAPAVEASSTK